MSSRRTVLVTVTTPYGEDDFAVAADVPVFQLVPSLLSATGGPAPAEGSDRARWDVVGEDARLIAPRDTLGGAHVLDGERLELVATWTSGDTT